MIDNTNPTGAWEFNAEVASCFANMLERSIPDYRSMRALVYKIGERYVSENSLIVDVGCSTGLAVEPFVEKFRDKNRFLLIDNAPAMVQACQERFKDEPSVTVKEGDLWQFLPIGEYGERPVSLALSVLSLQFMPTAYRRVMLEKLYDSMTDGGALILVEKVVAGKMDELMVDLYYQMKKENGYTVDQIMKKRCSLENVLSPLEPEWIETLLKDAGFSRVQMFWRCLNFCGWVAVR